MFLGASSWLARFGVLGLDQCDHRLPRRHPISQKTLPFGLLLRLGELVIRAADLFAAHHPSPGLQLQDHRPVDFLGFPESP